VTAGFSPLDDELALLPSRLSPWLVEAVVRLGTWMPFGRVPEALAFFTGVTIGEETARRLTEAAGAALEAVETAEVEQLVAERPPAPAGPAVQQLSVDGAMVPLVGGQWAEVKLLALGTVASQPAADGTHQPHTTDLSYVARLTDADTFAWRATSETHRRGTETAGQVAAVLDGAVWEQGFVDLHRPDAVRILDFPHAAQHISQAVALTLGADSPATRCWLATHLPLLKQGDAADVLEAVACLPTATAPDPVAAQATVVATLDYLAARWEQIQYATFGAQGLPIGSGCVEGGHKVVMQARLKGSGMHWHPANVNPLLARRCAACNDRWIERWAVLTHRWRTSTSIRRLLRHAVRHPPASQLSETRAPPSASAPILPPPPPPPPPPRAKRVVNGRPTPQHPWKRRPLLTPHPRVA
jgi:hypothetical protein